jgi:hypothetical protein
MVQQPVQVEGQAVLHHVVNKQALLAHAEVRVQLLEFTALRQNSAVLLLRVPVHHRLHRHHVRLLHARLENDLRHVLEGVGEGRGHEREQRVEQVALAVEAAQVLVQAVGGECDQRGSRLL